MDVLSAPQDFVHLAGRLLLAALLGAAVGFNREMLNKPAGLRTHALVSLGAAVAMVVGVQLTLPALGADAGAPARVVQGLLAGVGFIGGGVILHRERTGDVEGLTTAASIWVVAVVGVAVGAGLWRTAVAAVVLGLIVLSIGGIDRAVQKIAPKRGT